MIGVRLDEETERAVDALARRHGKTRSEVVRQSLQRYLEADKLASEARRQSLVIARDGVDPEVPDFIEHAVDWPDES